MGVPISTMYDCSKCGSRERRLLGCKRKRREPVYTTDCICEGAKKCLICGGIKRDNTIRVHRCPRAILTDMQISRIVPYFYHYLVSNFMEYPDRRGLFYQPIKLVKTFDILLIVKQREDKLKADRNGKT